MSTDEGERKVSQLSESIYLKPLPFLGERVERDVHRDLSQGRLQREAAVQKGGRRPAWHGER